MTNANGLTFAEQAAACALLDAGVADVSAVRDFIRWEPLGRGVEFDLAGFARWAERKAEK